MQGLSGVGRGPAGSAINNSDSQSSGSDTKSKTVKEMFSIFFHWLPSVNYLTIAFHFQPSPQYEFIIYIDNYCYLN